MEADRRTAIATLLREAEGAHAIYEADALNGVYDETWPHWYATHALEHGISDILGHDVTEDRLTAFLGKSYADFASADPKPAEPWPEWTANRITADL